MKQDPTRSVVGVGSGRLQVSMDHTVEFTPKRKTIMVLFTLVFLIMIYAVIPSRQRGSQRRS